MILVNIQLCSNSLQGMLEVNIIKYFFLYTKHIFLVEILVTLVFYRLHDIVMVSKLLESGLGAPNNGSGLSENNPVGSTHQGRLAVHPVDVVAFGSSADVESID